MVHFYENQKKQAVTAVVKDCKNDAKIKVAKRIGLAKDYIPEKFYDDDVCPCFGPWDQVADILKFDKLTMPNSISATVHVQEGDTYDRQKGRDAANDKVIKNFELSRNKAYTRWQVAMLQQIKNVSPETFEDALKKLK
jgi:hypothetical protein